MLLAQVLIPAATAAAVLFAAWFSLDTLRRPHAPETSPLAELHEVFGALLLRQLSILGAAVVVAAGATGLAAGYLGDSWQQGALAASSLFAGALCSGLAVHIGAGLATSVASRVATGAPLAAGTAISASIVPSLLASGLVTGALGGLIGAATWLLDEPIAHAPHLAVAFALGTGLVAAVSRLTGGIVANAAGLAESLTPLDGPQQGPLSPVERTASLSFAAARPAEIAESTALTTLAAMLIGTSLAWASGEAGWLLLPPVLMAVAVLSTIAGGLAAQLLSIRPARPDVLLVRSLAVTVVLGMAGIAAVSWAMLGDGWYWFFGAAAAGVVAALLLLFLFRLSPFGPWHAARRVARASQTSPASNVLTGFAAGLESAALTGLVVAAAVATGYALSSQAEVAHVTPTTAGLLGVGLAGMGFLLPGQLIASWSPVAALLSVRPASWAAGPAGEGELDALPDAPSAPGADMCGHLARAYALAAAALAVMLSLLAFSALIRANLASVAPDDPERYAALAQDLDLLQPGDDVKFAAANAIAAHVAGLDALRESIADDSRFGPREVEQLAAATRIETEGIIEDLIDRDSLTPRQAAGIEPSPLSLPRSLLISGARPEVLAAGFAGLVLAFLAVAAAIRSVGRVAGGLLSTAPASYTPHEAQADAPAGLPSVVGTAVRSAGGLLVPLFICAIIVPVALGAAVRYSLGESGNEGWLVVAGLLLVGTGAVMLAAVLDGAGTVWALAAGSPAAPANPDDAAAPPAGDPAALLAGSTGADTGATFHDAAVPALVAFSKLVAAAALAFAPLFIA